MDIDEDVLRTAKDIARDRNESLGKVLSALARKALEPSTTSHRERNGIQLLPRRPGARAVTPEMVRQLMEMDE